MLRPWTLIFTALAFVACSGEKKCQPRTVETSEECNTTDDCVKAGYFGLGCLNGTCARACTSDQDCAVVARVTSDDEEMCPDLKGQPTSVFICEQQICVNGCKDNSNCASGEQCVDGRCAIFAEGWEPRGNDTVTPESKGWNNDGRELQNVKTKIVFSGLPGCARGDEKCAGAAADGLRFLSLERVPTPPESTPTYTYTCRACACCLECQLSPPANNLTLDQCPRYVDIAAEATCPGETPAVCTNVCDQCDACLAAPATRLIGPELRSCEKDAARKTCPACEQPCPDGGPCPIPECTQCRDAERCELEHPGSSECTMLHNSCNAQGADGCFSTPVERPRSQLTDQEQSLLSPVVSLAGASGELVLELEYVPFDVGEQYRVVVQGVDPSMWMIKPQEVVLEMCGHDCNQPSSWMAVNTLSGAPASFPRDAERRNGVRLGAQSIIDWRSNRVQIPIPEGVRTGEFRFRFLPKLADNTRFGIDAITIRRRAQ